MANQEGWTIAYRNPRANTVRRVTDWSGTWEEAHDTAARAVREHPELQVFYVSTLAAERAGRVCAEDCGNILMDGTGRRVRMTETGRIAAIVSTPGKLPASDRGAWGYSEASA